MNDLEEEVYGQSKRQDFPIELLDRREEINSSKKRASYKRIRLYGGDAQKGELTTDNYVDSEIIDVRFYDRCLITFKNTHATASLTYQILACIDPKDWHTLKTATALAAGASDFEYISEAWAFAKISVKSTASGTPATILAFAGAKH